MDLKTCFLFLALGNLVLGCSILAFRHGTKNAPALNKFLFAKLLQTIAWGLCYCRDLAPEWLGIPFANALLFAGIALESEAMVQSVGRPSLQRLLLPLLTLGIAAFCALYFFSNNIGLRIMAASLIFNALYAVAAIALLLDWRGGSALRRLIGASSLTFASLIGVYGIWAAVRRDSNDDANRVWEMLAMLPIVDLYLLMLIGGVGFVLLASERQEAQLRRQSMVDPLTGAPNRRGFFNAVAPWLALARRPGQTTSVMVFDLDHLKRINDDYGHAIGDLVVKTVVGIGQKHLRESDLIGHLGSEEFAVLLPRTALAEAAIVAERMRQAIEEMPIKAERAMIRVTASFGLTAVEPDDSMVTLLKRADDALHEAKNLGRNRVAQAQRANDSVV